jgi:hypothetical protein
VRRWLASLDGDESGTLTPVEAVERASELTKDALADASEGSVLKRVSKARNSVLYEMNPAMARQLLRSLR